MPVNQNEEKENLKQKNAETAAEEAMQEEAAQEAQAETEAGAAAEDRTAESGAAETKTAEAAEKTAGEAAQEETEKEKSEAERQAELIAEKDRKIAEQEDRFKRLFAEFDNFRKRSETEKAARYSDGERAVLEKILPLIDNFERALASVPAEQKDNAWVKGTEMIYKSFLDSLAALGVTPIEAVGKPFDANLHNAVMHVEDEETAENTVVEEFQKGYLFRDRVLRYSMVKVAN